MVLTFLPLKATLILIAIMNNGELSTYSEGNKMLSSWQPEKNRVAISRTSYLNPRIFYFFERQSEFL